MAEPTSAEAVKVCCFGSSSNRTPQSYLDASFAMGALIAERGMVCVNGGGKDGCMGALNRGALSKGGKVAGNLHGGPNRLVSLPKACSVKNTVCASVWFTASWTCGHCCDGYKITTRRQWWGGSIPYQGVCK